MPGRAADHQEREVKILRQGAMGGLVPAIALVALPPAVNPDQLGK